MDINDYKNEVARFLKCYDKIVLQQFAPTLLYLPIYLLIKELREECGVNIEIRNSGSNDIETVSCINKSTNAFFNDDASSRELHFGLSELRDKKDNYHSFVFIQRAPIWGVALKNNAHINRIKSTLIDKGEYIYREFIGSKISLLDKDCFKNLRVSIYPEGSTIYRIFMEYLGGGVSDVILAPHTVDDNEFDDLFSEIVDVCLTVHPTYAIARSIEEKREIDLVFNYYGAPICFTEFYATKYSNIEKDDIFSDVMEMIKILVHEKISIFYQDINKYKNNANLFLNFKEVNCESNKNYDPCLISKLVGLKICDGKNKCTLPATALQQLLNDSRVYYHDTHYHDFQYTTNYSFDQKILNYEIVSILRNEKTGLNKENIEKYFSYHYGILNIETIKDYINGYIDPINKLSKICKKLEPTRHKSVIKYKKGNIPNNDNVDAYLFGTICSYLGISLNESSVEKTLGDINKVFKVKVDDLIEIFKFCKKITLDGFIEDSINQKTLFYFDNKKFVEDVFPLLVNNADDMIDPELIIKRREVGEDLFIYIVLIFQIKNIYKPNDTKFVYIHDSLNRKILEGYFIDNNYVCEHYFKGRNHGVISVLEEKIIHQIPGNTNYIINCCQESKCQWVFTFKVSPYNAGKNPSDNRGAPLQSLMNNT